MFNTNFSYTDHYAPDSSFINNVWYNRNNNELVVVIGDNAYLYENVDFANVRQLVDAYSVGTHYNTIFKGKFSPAKSLGAANTIGVSYERKKDLDDTNAVNVTPTKEFSLTAPAPVKSEEEVPRIKIHFVLDGHGDKVFKFKAKSERVEDAIEELRFHVAAFGATGKVKKVVVTFD